MSMCTDGSQLHIGQLKVKYKSEFKPV